MLFPDNFYTHRVKRFDAVPVLLGPTASGKTDVAIRLAKEWDAEIVSVDSRKVYKGLRVGTATPDGAWRNGAYVVDGVPHHLMDFLDPRAAYTAGDFCGDAERVMAEIERRGRVPFLVGGTGFYFKALKDGLPPLPPRDETLRAELERRRTEDGLAALRAELADRDPAFAAKVGANDKHKIIRALEVIRLTGRPYSAWKAVPGRASGRRFRVAALEYPAEVLARRIEERSRRMVQHGMIEETRALLASGCPAAAPALTSFGYRDAVRVVNGDLSTDDFLALLIRSTKAYAKRQRTYFRTQLAPRRIPCDASSKKSDISMSLNDFIGPR